MKNIIGTITIISGYRNWVKHRPDRPFPDPIEEQIDFFVHIDRKEQFLKEYGPGKQFMGKAITKVEFKVL